MKALPYMNEEDMKSSGIPIGARKNILSALAQKKRVIKTIAYQLRDIWACVLGLL